MTDEERRAVLALAQAVEWLLRDRDGSAVGGARGRLPSVRDAVAVLRGEKPPPGSSTAPREPGTAHGGGL
jgi:hypothetical protein